MDRTIYWAPAKLNLFLHILQRRSDGYHEIQTAFQLIDYCDELQFTLRHDQHLQLTVSPSNIMLGDPENNLIIRAARLLQQTYQCQLGADIQLHKRIPIGSGLGGGSSDAATTLLALNTLWQLNCSLPTLAAIGKQLGADVPIFIYGQTAWGEGIGDKLTPIASTNAWYVIVVPPCSISSAELFSAPELTRNTPAITIQQFLSRQVPIKNDFEPVAAMRYPVVAQALQWLNQFAEARLTGSGSCLFAAFNSEQEAQEIVRQIPSPMTGFAAKAVETRFIASLVS